MKKSLITCIALVVTIFSSAFATTPINEDPIKVAAYNIRYYNPNDVEDTWESRNKILEESLKKNDFDIFGTQEPFLNQMEDMLVYLSKDYNYVGTTITGDSSVSGKHFNAIFYKKDRFEVLDEGIFWLSQTPDTPNTKSWDSYSVRMAVWALFKDLETGKEFYNFNMHFDHLGEVARVESAKLVVERVEEIAKDIPAFITGDFNSHQGTEAFKILTSSFDDTHAVADKRINGDWPTLNSFKFIEKPKPNAKRIDHVFVKGGTVKVWELVNDSYQGKYPSDHFPVAIKWIP